eukprot:Nk52_evm26s2340 gene=Nk52_evmTU26s2340
MKQFSRRFAFWVLASLLLTFYFKKLRGIDWEEEEEEEDDNGFLIRKPQTLKPVQSEIEYLRELRSRVDGKTYHGMEFLKPHEVDVIPPSSLFALVEEGGGEGERLSKDLQDDEQQRRVAVLRREISAWRRAAKEHNRQTEELYAKKWNGIQDMCHPRFYEGASMENIENFKGVVVFHHGYTACPYQYYDWGSLLQKEGYDVFIPLLPGHGAEFVIDPKTGQKRNNLHAPPRKVEEYLEYLKGVNDIVALSPSRRMGKERVVGGLSEGGSIAILAMYEMQTNESFPGENRYKSESMDGFGEEALYTKALLINPLLAIGPNDRPWEGMIIKGGVWLFKHLPRKLQLRWPIGWDKDCYKHIAQGWHGFCRFTWENMQAGFDLAARAERAIKPAPPGLKIQFLIDEHDSSTTVKSVYEAFDKTKIPDKSKTNATIASICELPAQFGHTFFCHPENYWRTEIICKMSSFITGKNLYEDENRQKSKDLDSEGFLHFHGKYGTQGAKCHLSCTPSTCKPHTGPIQCPYM